MKAARRSSRTTSSRPGTIPVPSDKSDLYNNMVSAQATANSRVIYTTAVYNELLNAMQGIMDGSPGSSVIEALVAAGAQ